MNENKHSRFKEIACVLFGHDWDESGHRKCMEHSVIHGKYNTCSHCGLTKHIGPLTCEKCFGDFCAKHTEGGS